MELGTQFWKRLKQVILTLIVVALLGAVACYLYFDGLKQVFYPLCSLLAALNFAFMYGFIRANDKRRPHSKH